jgi:hypothetical protein
LVVVQTTAISGNCFHPPLRNIEMNKSILLASLLAAAALVACGKKEAPAVEAAPAASAAVEAASVASEAAAPASDAASK